MTASCTIDNYIQHYWIMLILGLLFGMQPSNQNWPTSTRSAFGCQKWTGGTSF